MERSNLDTNNIIAMAWDDKTSFDEIKLRTGLCEAGVIKLMRASLKPRSYKLWRARVCGRRKKHAQLSKNYAHVSKRHQGSWPIGVSG